MIAFGHRWLQLICAAFLLAVGGERTNAAPPITVYPTGSFPLDPHNVQAAIDRGGTVILKATNAGGQPTVFDFGPPDSNVNGGVNINTEVTILGERVGENATTIRGGVNSILGAAPVKSTIQNITFEGPLVAPIAFFRSAGANITGNRIRKIVPLPLPVGFSEIEGIFVSGNDDPPNAITGKIKIADNIIEIARGDFVNGMQFDEVAADIEITGNTVDFTSSDGAVQSLGILVFRSSGKVNVKDNLVTMGPGNPDVFPSGIFVGGHPEARYMISHNTVITNHPNADGIDVVGFSESITTQNAKVQDNHLSVHSMIPTAGGIAFVGAVKNSQISSNQIEGTSGNALQVLGLDSTLTADSNKVTGNRISQLSPLNGDIFLGPDSINTLVTGHCSTYVDLGVMNHVMCGTPLGPAVTQPATSSLARAGVMLGIYGDATWQARLDAIRSRLNRVQQ